MEKQKKKKTTKVAFFGQNYVKIDIFEKETILMKHFFCLIQLNFLNGKTSTTGKWSNKKIKDIKIYIFLLEELCKQTAFLQKIYFSKTTFLCKE